MTAVINQVHAVQGRPKLTCNISARLPLSIARAAIGWASGSRPGGTPHTSYLPTCRGLLRSHGRFAAHALLAVGWCETGVPEGICFCSLS